jgi:ankyrin repeat protein
MPMLVEEMDASTHAEQMKAAIEDEDLNKIRALVREGFDLADPVFSTGPHTAFHHAANMGCIDAAKVLLELGANIEGKLDSGQTALHLAAFHGRPEMLRFLIDAGADAQAVDDRGDSVLHWWARGCPGIQTCNILLDAGCDPNVTDRRDTTPLHIVKANIGPSVALIRRGAKSAFMPLEAPSTYLTPFQAAVATGVTNLVAALIESKRESVSQRTLDGRSLFDLASGSGPTMRKLIGALSAQEAVAEALGNEMEGVEDEHRKSRSMPAL